MPDDLNFTPNTGVGDTQIASARQDWIALGLDAAAFDRAVSGAPAPAPTPPPENTPPAAPQTAPRWSNQQAAETIAIMRGRGVPDADLRTTLRGDGFSEQQVDALLAPAPADTRTDDQKLFEAAGLGAGRREQYRPLDYIGRAPEGDLHAFNEDALTFLAGIEAPALLGPSLVEECLDAAKAYATLPETHRELYHQTEDQRLRDLLGSAKANEVNGKIMGLLNNPAVPDNFLAWLKDSGALRRADVRYQLANIADIRSLSASVKGGASIDSLLSAR